MSYYNSQKAFKPGQFTLLPVVNIIPYNDLSNTSHRVMNIFPLVAEINIYESIYQPFMTGNVVIADTDNMFQKDMPIVGFERLEFQLMTPGVEGIYDFQTQTGFPVHIYSVTDRKADSHMAQGYVLHFCSQEMIRNKTEFVSKAVYNTHENIVSELLRNHMNSKKALIVEKSINRHKYVLPYANPLTHIQTLAKKTQSEYHDNPGFLFFENMLGFHFRSLQGLTNLNSGDVRQSKHDIKYQFRRSDRRDNGDEKVDYNYGVIKDYNIVKQFDTIDSMDEGAYASELIYHDQLTKKFNSNLFAYNEHFQNNPKMEDGQGGKIGKFIYRNNKQIQELPTKRFFKSTTSKLFTESSITQPSDVDIVQKRVSKHSNILSNEIEITVPGYLGIQTGDVIEVEFPDFAHANNSSYEDKKDDRLSGRYLITYLRHVFTRAGAGEHKMILTISKDAFNTQLPNSQSDTFTSLETDKNVGMVEAPQI